MMKRTEKTTIREKLTTKKWNNLKSKNKKLKITNTMIITMKRTRMVQKLPIQKLSRSKEGLQDL